MNIKKMITAGLADMAIAAMDSDYLLMVESKGMYGIHYVHGTRQEIGRWKTE